MAAMGSSPARRPRQYRTRRPMRAVWLAVVLSVVAAVVWASVLKPRPTADSCQVAAKAAGSAVTPGQRLSVNGLDKVSPAPPQQVRVQVLNANGTRGEAAIVGGELRLSLAYPERVLSREEAQGLLDRWITALAGQNADGGLTPSDVLAGWCAGFAWAMLCWLAARALQRWRGQGDKA